MAEALQQYIRPPDCSLHIVAPTEGRKQYEHASCSTFNNHPWSPIQWLAATYELD